jgi:hypothetical protein
MSRSGKRVGFLPFDLAQEENIADIKVSSLWKGTHVTDIPMLI